MLLHTCCGPCATEVAPYFKENGYEPTLFYYNPNIQPLAEYEKRRQGLMFFAQEKGFPLYLSGEYEPLEFLKNTLPLGEKRCNFCYTIRLQKTGNKAKELGFKAFSTTLLVSPYQDYRKIKTIGFSIAEKLGLEFLAPELSHLYKKTIDNAKELKLYRQSYCGCFMSELERYSYDLGGKFR